MRKQGTSFINSLFIQILRKYDEQTAIPLQLQVLAEHEAAEIGVQWADFLTDTNTGDLPFGSIVLVLIFDTFLYILLAWLVGV